MRPLRQRVPVRAVRGGDDVVLLERLADPHRNRLLADRDMEESGQLPGAEALLHLLLETADEQHFPQEFLQASTGRNLPLFLKRGHAPTS
jgi:hypothetical protein